jgi:ABC-2 type transport system ATP-binding protein
VKGTPLKTSVISLENVRKSYKGGFELGPLDLEIEPGHVVAVLGPNGAGKSTLFGMLMNLLRPDSGTVNLFGLSHPRDEVAIKRRIGYVPEYAVYRDDMSASYLGDFFSYWYPNWDQGLYEDLVGRARIDPKKRFGKLSKGLRRRLLFALALAVGPQLLLLDEPTTGVDLFARQEMLEEIWRFVRDGRDDEGPQKTVVFSTQTVEEARQIADRVAFFADGEFLGLHDKGALLDGWKTLLVDGRPEESTPGVVGMESGSPTRVVSDSWRETAEALSAQGIRVVREASVDLEEILSHLIRKGRERQGASRRRSGRVAELHPRSRPLP